MRRDDPAVLGAEVASSRTGGGDWRPIDHATQVGTNRHYVAFGISGDIDLLERWPDRCTALLTPVNDFADDSHWERLDPSEPSTPAQHAGPIGASRQKGSGSWACVTTTAPGRCTHSST